MWQRLNYVRLMSKNLLNTCHVPKLSHRKFTITASYFKTFEPDYLDVSLKKMYFPFLASIRKISMTAFTAHFLIITFGLSYFCKYFASKNVDTYCNM